MDRRHADVPGENIRSDSGFALLSCGEEPCPLSLHTGRLIHHPAPMAKVQNPRQSRHGWHIRIIFSEAPPWV
ncbi:MAG: hypothetical protein R6V02_10520 [Candidatus Aminicenantes bacterium]